MPKRSFVVFLSIVLSVYALINWYIFISGLHALPQQSDLHMLFPYIFLPCALSYIVGRFLERRALSVISKTFVWIGSFWLAAMVYFFLILLCIDLLRTVNYIFPFFPSFITHYEQAKYTTFLVVVGFVALVVLLGHINTLMPRIRRLSLTIPKDGGSLRKLTIAVASDIHLGTIIGRRRLEYIVQRINALQADLVLLPGDVVDEDLAPVIQENLGATLEKITARFGVIAVTGNHEYIGGVEPAYRYLSDHNIRMLRDQVMEIHESFYIVGREDRSITQFAGKTRKPLEELMKAVDRRRPVIMMDHQPFHLEEAEQQGVDLQLSGHTHHGQMWPFNFITKKVYEMSWGYKKKGNTHVYVSCGVGTWGPPVRTGNRPEIILIELAFTAG